MDEILLSLTCVLFYFVIKLIDSKPSKIKYYFKWYMYYAYVTVVTTLLSFVLVWRGRDFRNVSIVMKFFNPMIKFHGMTWHLENGEILEAKGTAVIISNHQSSLDLLGLFHASPTVKKWIPAAKKELVYAGPIGLVTYLIGTVLIDRKNPTEAYKRLEKAMEVLLKDEVKIWMFPEGTRNIKKKVKLLPFKKGAFKVAVATQSPIIPVVFSPYYFEDENKYIFDNGGHVIMRCLEPVPTAGLTMDDVPKLQERLYSIVLHAYEELSKEVLYKSLTGLELDSIISERGLTYYLNRNE